MVRLIISNDRVSIVVGAPPTPMCGPPEVLGVEHRMTLEVELDEAPDEELGVGLDPKGL